MGAPLNVEEINLYIVYIPHLKNIHIFSPTIRYCFVFSYPICLLVFPTFFPSLSQLSIYIPLSILSVRSTWREMASRSRSWRWRIFPGLQSSTSALYGTGKYARYRDVFRNQVEGSILAVWKNVAYCQRSKYLPRTLFTMMVIL